MSVSPSVCLSVMRLNCEWCIPAAFAKLIWPLAIYIIKKIWKADKFKQAQVKSHCGVE